MDNQEPYEPEEGDYTTTDHRHVYQNGRLVLSILVDDADFNAEMRAYMDWHSDWSNVWWISDYGNCHLITL